MTNSEIFKAAHKLAKALKNELGGDYIVYFAYSLKGVIKMSKKLNKEVAFKKVNELVKRFNGTELLTFSKKISATHGLKEFDKEYQMNNFKLESGQFFGEVFYKNGKTCAYVRSFITEQIAY